MSVPRVLPVPHALWKVWTFPRSNHQPNQRWRKICYSPNGPEYRRNFRITSDAIFHRQRETRENVAKPKRSHQSFFLDRVRFFSSAVAIENSVIKQFDIIFEYQSIKPSIMGVQRVRHTFDIFEFPTFCLVAFGLVWTSKKYKAQW